MAKLITFLLVIVVILAGAAVALFAMSSHSSLAFDPVPLSLIHI